MMSIEAEVDGKECADFRLIQEVLHLYALFVRAMLYVFCRAPRPLSALRDQRGT